AVFEREIYALAISRLRETLAQRRNAPWVRVRRKAAEIADHRPLLRARRQRPCRRAEQRYQCAAVHTSCPGCGAARNNVKRCTADLPCCFVNPSIRPRLCGIVLGGQGNRCAAAMPPVTACARCRNRPP